jgi:GDP-L-fucose synthase
MVGISTAAKIYVAGHLGMVGSALVRRLRSAGYQNLLLRTHGELDLLDQRSVLAFLHAEVPDYIFVAAARVGGHPRQQHVPGRFYLPEPDD